MKKDTTKAQTTVTTATAQPDTISKSKAYFETEFFKEKAKEHKKLLQQAQTTTDSIRNATADTDKAPFEFPELITAYETNAILRYMERKDSPKDKASKETETEYTTALLTLAKALTYSVLKKCIDPQRKTGNTNENSKTGTYNNRLLTIKQSIANDFQILENTATTANNATELYYDDNGNLKERTKDKTSLKAFNKLITKSLNGDGLALVHDAVKIIEEETRKAFDERNNISISFMETPYTIRRLKQHIIIKSVDNIGGWETIEVTPIQIVFRAIRQSIEDNGNTRISNSYSYIQDISTDPETQTVETIYHRLGKYADLGGFERNSNGQTDIYTTGIQAFEDINTIVEKLNLTVTQAETLKLRLQGYGIKAIARYFGINAKSVRERLEYIQKKATKNGYTPTETKPRYIEPDDLTGKNYNKALETAQVTIYSPVDIVCMEHYATVKANFENRK